MAGDWIKMQSCLPDKPEVWAIANITGCDPDAVIGKLLRVWAWFDAHTKDGNAVGVTFALLDRIASVTGFADAMEKCGWLERGDNTVSIPHFSRHNGKTAKTRASTNDRVAKMREAQQECNAATVTETVTREEKRREEVKDKHIVPNGTASAKNFNPQHELESLGVDGQVASDWLKVRKAKNKPLTATALKKLVNQASIAGMEVSAVIELCCEKAWVGFSAEWVKGAGTHPSTPSDRKKWRVHPSGAIETWDNSLGMWMLSTYKTKEEAHAAMGDSL